MGRKATAKAINKALPFAKKIVKKVVKKAVKKVVTKKVTKISWTRIDRYVRRRNSKLRKTRGRVSKHQYCNECGWYFNFCSKYGSSRSRSNCRYRLRTKARACRRCFA